MDIDEIEKHLKEYNKSPILICEDCGCLFESNEYQKEKNMEYKHTVDCLECGCTTRNVISKQEPFTFIRYRDEEITNKLLYPYWR